MSQTLVAIFDSYATANQAVEKLVKSGISRSSIDVKSTDSAGAASDTTTTTTTTKKTEDDDVFGSIGRFFGDLFGDDNDREYAGHYSEAVRRGHAVLTLEVDDANVDQVHTQLIEAGAVDVDEQVTAWRGQGYTGGTAAGAVGSMGAAGATADAKGVIPVVEEELEVGKRRVDQGRVRVVTRVESKPVHESVQLESERAVVERHPVDRPASEADLAGFKDRTIEVRESAEKAVVSKSAHVVEEVAVGKQVSSETKEIDDTVRHTEVDVVRDDGKTVDPAAGTTKRPDDRRN